LEKNFWTKVIPKITLSLYYVLGIISCGGVKARNTQTETKKNSVHKGKADEVNTRWAIDFYRLIR